MFDNEYFDYSPQNTDEHDIKRFPFLECIHKINEPDTTETTETTISEPITEPVKLDKPIDSKTESICDSEIESESESESESENDSESESKSECEPIPIAKVEKTTITIDSDDDEVVRIKRIPVVEKAKKTIKAKKLSHRQNLTDAQLKNKMLSIADEEVDFSDTTPLNPLDVIVE